MGKRGPPPKPSKQKMLEGTYRKDRAAKNEIAPLPGTPVRPSWLDARARREWDRVVPQLAALGVLSDVDQALLADYCAAQGLAQKAQEQLNRQGLVITVPGGAKQKNPLIKIAQEARAQARLLAAEFGLSPSSRSRISAPDKDEGLAEANERMKAAAQTSAPTDKTEEFLFGPRLVKTEPA